MDEKTKIKSFYFKKSICEKSFLVFKSVSLPLATRKRCFFSLSFAEPLEGKEGNGMEAHQSFPFPSYGRERRHPTHIGK